MKSPWLAGIGLLVASATAQDTIRWSKAENNELPKAAADDSRPTILYFTFDT